MEGRSTMKRFIALISVAMLLLALSGCGNSKKIEELQKQVDALQEQLAKISTSEETPSAPDPNAQSLRDSISTVEQAVAYFDEKFPSLYMSAHSNNGEDAYWYLRSGDEVAVRAKEEVVGRSCIVQALTYLLGDDMDISTIIGFRHDETGGCPLWGMNCIKTDSGYKIFDPVAGMQGDEASRYGAMLPDAEVSTLAEYAELIMQDPAIAATLDNLYIYDGVQLIIFKEYPQWVIRSSSRRAS